MVDLWLPHGPQPTLSGNAKRPEWARASLGLLGLGLRNALPSAKPPGRIVTISDRDAATVIQRLKLQDRPQPFIDRALKARRQRAGMFSQETAIESKQLGDVYDRLSEEARRTRRQQDISRGLREFDIAGDR
jgi:hypothetical protein